MFTKQHYKAIAKIVKDNTTIDSRNEYVMNVDFLMNDLADYFVKDNKLFDREKFLTACGFE